MIVFSKKEREHLRTMGQVVIFRPQELKNIGTDKVDGKITDKVDGIPLYNVSIGIEIENCTVEDLENSVEDSGFKSLKEWINEIKQSHNTRNIKGFLYYVALKNDKKS